MTTSTDDNEPDRRAQGAIYRILDANLNRCLEGLRVVEEYLRFVVEDRHLASACKQLRHDLTASMAPIMPSRLHAARDVTRDVGTSIRTSSEYRRSDLSCVLAANTKRIEQALRSLEEYSKVIDPQLAPALESLRYRAYSLARSVTILKTSLERLAAARIYVLVDGRSSLERFRKTVCAALEGSADVLQLRDKNLPDKALLERAHVLRELTWKQGALFVMNDRVDLAVLARADGVHVGQDELTVGEVRKIIGPDALIGVSTHDIAQARQAGPTGAGYLGCGPTFASATKQFRRLAAFLREVSQEIRLPAFAIGGIDQENISQICAAGIHRIAVCSSVIETPDPAAAVRALRGKLECFEPTAPRRTPDEDDLPRRAGD